MGKLTSIVSGLNALAIFFCFPETHYIRETSTIRESTDEENVGSTAQDVKVLAPDSHCDTSARPKKTFVQQLKPWSTINPTSSYFNLFFRPWFLVVYPAVAYATLNLSSGIAWVLAVLNTNASIFQSPPYNMSPGINSLINIPAFIGVTLGSYYAGAFTDRYAEWRARRSDGIFEPETRLVALVLPFFVVPAGIIMFVPWICL
jgi:hypothetical protein